MIITFRSLIRSIYFKTIILFLTALAIAGFFAVPLTRFNSTDPIPNLKPINYEKEKEFGIFKTRVSTGLFIKNFPHFDMIKNKFIIDLVMWFEFNTDEVMLDTIDKFSFENGKIIRKSPPDIKLLKNRTFAKYTVRVELNGNLHYYHFPLEDHHLSIVVTNHFFTPYEVIFDVSNTAFVIDPSVFVANWKIDKLNTNYGYYENFLDQVDTTKKTLTPIAVFMVDFIKRGVRKAFVVFVPIFIAFFLSLISFLLMLRNIIGRTTLSVSAISALLGYRFVIENMMPKVDYFTTTDHIYVILLVLTFLIFIFQTLIVTKRMTMMRDAEGKTTVALAKLQTAEKEHMHLTNDLAFLVVIAIALILVGFVVMR